MISRNELYRHIRSPSIQVPNYELMTYNALSEPFNFCNNKTQILYKKIKSNIDKAHICYVSRLMEAMQIKRKKKSSNTLQMQLPNIYKSRASIGIKNRSLLNVLYNKGVICRGVASKLNTLDINKKRNTECITTKPETYTQRVNALHTIERLLTNKNHSSYSISSDISILTQNINASAKKLKPYKISLSEAKSKSSKYNNKSAVSVFREKVGKLDKGWEPWKETAGFSNNALPIE